MHRQREIELKLEVDRDGADALWRGRGGAGQTRHLLATYYDTPDSALRDHGLSFRVRRAGDMFVQTVKVARRPGAGLFDRAEWERLLDGDEPDLSVIDDAGLRDALRHADDWANLHPAFTVDVERMIWRIDGDDGEAEVVLDIGKVVAGGQERSFHELELELKDGSSHTLFRLARELAAMAPMRVGVLTKAERGYRLLADTDGRPAKAEPVALQRGATAAEAFQTIAHACLRHFRLNEPLVSERNAGGLHQSRVALRRLRAALSLFRDVVADDRVGSIRTGLRDLARVLGEARNLDVLLQRLTESSASADAQQRLQAEREAAYDTALDALGSERTRLAMLDLLEWVELGRWRAEPRPEALPLLTMPAEDFAIQVLDRYRRRLKKRGRGLADLDDEARHQVRIEAKKLRYASEFFAGLFGRKKERRRHKKFLTALEAMQTHLGALNDIATGREIEHRLSARGIEVPALGILEDEARHLRDAESGYDDLVDAKPFWR